MRGPCRYGWDDGGGGDNDDGHLGDGPDAPASAGPRRRPVPAASRRRRPPPFASARALGAMGDAGAPLRRRPHFSPLLALRRDLGDADARHSGLYLGLAWEAPFSASVTFRCEWHGGKAAPRSLDPPSSRLF